MTIYEYNITFTFEPKSPGPYIGHDDKEKDKIPIDKQALEFMTELIDLGIKEISFYVSDKERIN